MELQTKDKIQNIVDTDFAKSRNIFVNLLVEGLDVNDSKIIFNTLELLSISSSLIRKGKYQEAEKLRSKARAIYRNLELHEKIYEVFLNFDYALDAELYYNKYSIKQEKDYTKAVVYFIYNSFTNRVKIGTSIDEYERVSTLENQSGVKLELLKTIKGSYTKENEIHKKFKHLRIKGEWFEYTDELKKYIKSLK